MWEFLRIINIQTIIFLIGIALLTQAGVLWFQSHMVREYNGIRTAAFGNFMFGLGMLLASFRGMLSDAVSIVIANYLIIIGAAMQYAAIGKFLKKEINVWVLVAAVLPVLVLFPYYTFYKNDFMMRVVLSSLCFALLMMAIAFRLFDLRTTNFSRSAMFLAMVSVLYTVLLVLRSIGFFLFPADDMLSPTPLAALHSIGVFIASFFWSIGFLIMVSHRLQADLNEIATLDILTRIPNRRAMMPMLEAEFSRYSRTHVSFSILLVDVDHFKEVNDLHGHETGDVVLYHVAQIMKNTLRKQDTISRWGGEEFLILLPATTTSEAYEIGERLRKVIESSRFDARGHQIFITVSIGVGSSLDATDVSHIYKISDMALYQAKSTRNMVVYEHVKPIAK